MSKMCTQRELSNVHQCKHGGVLLLKVPFFVSSYMLPRYTHMCLLEHGKHYHSSAALKVNGQRLGGGWVRMEEQMWHDVARVHDEQCLIGCIHYIHRHAHKD